MTRLMYGIGKDRSNVDMKRQDIITELEIYLKTEEKKIYRLAYSYTKNDADTKDMIQNAVIKAFRSCHKIKKDQYLATWFYRILINTCLDHLRKQKHHSFFPIEEEIPESIDRNQQFLISTELQQLLNLLDPLTKTIVILRYFEERQLLEISEIVKLPLSTVKTKLYKGLQLMRIQLKEQEL